LSNHQNNYAENSSTMSNTAKNFNVLVTGVNILHNYFNNSKKIICRSAAKFLDTSAKKFLSAQVLDFHSPIVTYFI